MIIKAGYINIGGHLTHISAVSKVGQYDGILYIHLFGGYFHRVEATDENVAIIHEANIDIHRCNSQPLTNQEFDLDFHDPHLHSNRRLDYYQLVQLALSSIPGARTAFPEHFPGYVYQQQFLILDANRDCHLVRIDCKTGVVEKVAHWRKEDPRPLLNERFGFMWR